MLIRRARCVLFTALRAGVAREELDEALDVAEAARERELAAEPRLRLVAAAE